MADIVLKRLDGGLPPESQRRLREITTRHRQLRPHEDVARQGETSSCRYFVLDGMACRYKVLPGGKRVILAYLLPGDFCAPHLDFSGPFDHGLSSLPRTIVAEVPVSVLQESLRADPDLNQALGAACRIQVAIERQWLAMMSCPADKKLAHLLCELRARMAQVGLANAHGFVLPLTQQELSEAVGLSTVHVNRTLQHLKDIGLVRVTEHHVLISDLPMLESFAEFDPAYLGLASPAEERLAPASG